MALPNEFERKLICQLRRSCKDVIREMESDPGDMFFVRWLRARDYDMKRAEQMLRENRRWRRQNKVDNILEIGLDTFLKLNYPLHLGITDKRNRPVLVLPLGKWNLRDAVSNGLSQRFTTYVIQCVEAVMKTVENRDSVRKPCAMPISQFSVLVDFDGFQCSQLLDIKVLRMVHQMLLTLRENYPETMAGCLCVNCPRFVTKFLAIVSSKFKSTVLCSNFVQSKLEFFGKIKQEDDMRAVLNKMMHEEEIEKCVYLFSVVD